MHRASLPQNGANDSKQDNIKTKSINDSDHIYKFCYAIIFRAQYGTRLKINMPNL